MEYRSRAELLGLPLFHFCLATPTGDGLRRKHAVGWIAIGDTALGVLFALGGGAVGGIAIGGASVGVISLGGLAIGGLAFGGCALGYWALGGAAIALQAALGGLAVAKEFALGGAAHALHANDEAAKAFFSHNLAFRIGEVLMHLSPFAMLLLLIPILANRKRPTERDPIG